MLRIVGRISPLFVTAAALCGAAGIAAWYGPRWLAQAPRPSEVLDALAARDFAGASDLAGRYLWLSPEEPPARYLYAFPRRVTAGAKAPAILAPRGKVFGRGTAM